MDRFASSRLLYLPLLPYNRRGDMPFAVHAAVIVKSIGRTGEVVEVARGGRYRVRVGGIVMSCREDDLRESADASRAKRKRRAGGRSTAQTEGSGGVGAVVGRSAPGRDDRVRPVATIDLHGLTVQEALEAVAQRLDAILLAGVERLDIVHGRGSGRVKNAVHRYLKEVSAVRRFELAPGNPGVTRVFL